MQLNVGMVGFAKFSTIISGIDGGGPGFMSEVEITEIDRTRPR